MDAKKQRENQSEEDFLRQTQVLVIQTFPKGRAFLKAETIAMGVVRNVLFLYKTKA